MYRFLLGSLLLALMLSASGCKRPLVRTSCDVPDQGNLTIEASDRANPDDLGRALPTIIRIYQLQTLGPLELATFEDIWKQPEETLGEALLASDELTIYPRHTRSKSFDRNPDANYIVAVAIVRKPQGVSWRTIMELPPPANELRCAAMAGQEEPEEEPPPPPQVAIHLYLDGYSIEGSLRLIPVEEGGCAPGDFQCLSDRASEATEVPETPETPTAPEVPEAPSAPSAPDAPAAPEAPGVP